MAARRGFRGAVILLGVGMFLLLVNVLGLLVDPAVPGPEPAPGMIAGYDYAAQPPDALRKALSSGAAGLSLAEANSLVFLSLRHSEERRIKPYENWLLWLIGHVYEPLSRTQSTDRLVAGGSGNCGEKAQVLKTVTERAGWPSRFIGLNGHIALEVRTGSGWQVADPDYGVTYPFGLEQLQGREGAATMRGRLEEAGYGADAIEAYVSLFQSSGDNLVFETGQPLSPRLYLIERVSDVLKWLVPLCLGALGWFALRRGSRKAGR